jgi:hypothetical protein
MKMDWKKQAGASLKPEGTYRVRITDWEETRASTGTPQVKWTAEIVDGHLAGQSIIDHTAVTEKALWRLARLVSACNVNVDELPIMETGSLLFKKTLDACIGKTVNWSVEVSTFEGKTNNKIVGYVKDKEQKETIVAIEEDEVPAFLEEGTA